MPKSNFTLKKGSITALLIALFIFHGCGQNESNETSDEFAPDIFENNIAEKNEMNYPEIEDQVKDNYEDSLKRLSIPLNTNAEEFHLNKEDYLPLSTSYCKTDGKKIYLETALGFYVMPIGTDELNPINIEIPEGMVVCNYTFDVYGRMHLIVAERSKEDYFIWRLDENYQIEKTIEISEYYTDSAYYSPYWFLILDDGTYYIQWPLEQDGIIVSSDGMLLHEFTLESLGIGGVRAVAVGKDGHIYIMHSRRDENLEIVKLDLTNYLIEDANPALFLPYGEVLYTMSSGTDTDLLLASPYSGVWAIDIEKGIMENRVPLADLRLGMDKNSELAIRLFLPDGRFFLMADSTVEGHLLIKYVPVGK
ncbi:MAG: hypothetical protein FWG91_08820 [Lachnospiraceae bacterium]|nr:hypothetical protein [Lachnospiraceae bacterium]